MPKIFHSERKIQNRIFKLLTEVTRNNLGYHYLGEWSKREGSGHRRILLQANLKQQNFSGTHVSAAL